MTSSEPGASPRSLQEQAVVLAGFAQAEARLFEILGGWVGSTRTTRAKLLLDRHSAHAAWRSSQWWDRVPSLSPPPDLRSGSGVVSGIDAVEDLMGDVIRLVGAYRFAFPRLYAAYTEERLRSSEVADAAVLRTLAQVQSDLQGDLLDGEALLQDLMRSETDVEEADRALIGLERRVVGS